MAPKVYVTDGVFPSLDIEREVLASVGAELALVQCKTEEDVARYCHDADGLLVVYTPIGAKALAGLPNCRVVVRMGIGYDPLDLSACTEFRVCAVNVPDYCVPEVSDHALALILTCARRIAKLDRAVRAGKWSAAQTVPTMQRLGEQVLGIVGFGRIGRELGRKARALGLTVLAYDPYVGAETLAAYGAQRATLAELLARSDYVSINCLLNAETYHLIGEAELRQMKRGAYLVNTSRGPVVDEAALIQALREGLITGAALDVLETEPLAADSPLLSMENVVLTPHAAYYSERAYKELHRRSAQEVARVLSGHYPHSLLNPEVKERLRALGRELAD